MHAICEGLANTAAFNTKVGEVENKVPDVSKFVKKTTTDFDAKITDIEGKYFTAADYNNFTNNILVSKINLRKLVN